MTTERDFELAEVLADAERKAGVDRSSARVSVSGRNTCFDCGVLIDAERKAAAPFATRCVACQRAFERAFRHG